VPLRVILDEHISPTVALRLQPLGCDVVSIRDRGWLGKKDWELMPLCIRHRYTMFTNNADDWKREHARCLARGETHPGVLIVGDWTTEEYYWALRAYFEASPDP
jgi:predicted nuclease of predicted toxin-antitoxin system